MEESTGLDLAGIFNCLHDGWLEGYEVGAGNQLTLSIRCSYLAERINPLFSSFQLQLVGLTAIKFLPWTNPGEDSEALTEISQIINGCLEIASATYALPANIVQIFCNQASTTGSWMGGTLEIACVTYRIVDEGGTSITSSELQALAWGYWSDWSAAAARQQL
jgi:hypothetical protein